MKNASDNQQEDVIMKNASDNQQEDVIMKIASDYLTNGQIIPHVSN